MINTKKTKTLLMINNIILGMFAFATLYPFYYFLILSFNDGMDSMKGGIYFCPRVLTLSNYLMAFQNSNIVNSFAVSIFRTVVGTAISVMLMTMVGFALSRKQLLGRNAITFYFYFTTLIGGGMVPTYLLYRELNLLNSVWIYIIPSLYDFFNIVLLRTYFTSIPDTLEEAASIDGSGIARTYFSIFMPLAKPVLATITLFTAVAHWNDWFTGAFYVTNQNLQPAATLLQKIIDEVDLTNVSSSKQLEQMFKSSSTTTPEALRMTFVIIITLPIVCVYPFLQKYFVKGVMVGAIKN